MRLQRGRTARVTPTRLLDHMLRRAILATMLAAPVAPPARAADLVIEVHGVFAGNGEVRAALFDNAADFQKAVDMRAMITQTGQVSTGWFPQDDRTGRMLARMLSVAADSPIVHVRYANVQPGEYAVGLFQDLNGDWKLDGDFSRNTTEPWGVSNNPKPEARPPTWEEARFAIPPEGLSIVITLVRQNP